MALFEFNRSFGPVAGVGQLSFERTDGMVRARDGQGKLVMSISTGPGFGERLATAFYEYRQAIHKPEAASTLAGEARFPPVQSDGTPGGVRFNSGFAPIEG